MKKVNEILKTWENLSHDVQNQVINDHSAGCIENGSNTFIEILLFDPVESDLGPNVYAILYMDHNHHGEFMTFQDLAFSYEWEPDEILDQLEDLTYGLVSSPTKSTLQSLLKLSLDLN